MEHHSGPTPWSWLCRKRGLCAFQPGRKMAMYIAICIHPMDKTYSIAEARHDLANLVHEAETGTPVTLTRRGKPVAVLLSHGQYEELVEKKRGYWSALRELQKAYDLSGSGLTESELESLRDRSPPRPFSR